MSGEGFLSRWSKRKAEQVGPEPVADPVELNPSTGKPLEAKMPESAGQSDTLPDTAQPKSPLPTIESLTNESDFTPFMARDVSPEMRNQAMKKLFTDPHYNIMDGLDTYIDDYGKPDPLPEGWLQMMNQSKTLRLFETKEEEAARLGVDTHKPASPDQASRAADEQRSTTTSDDVRLVEGADVELAPTELDPPPLAPPPTESNA